MVWVNIMDDKPWAKLRNFKWTEAQYLAVREILEPEDTPREVEEETILVWHPHLEPFKDWIVHKRIAHPRVLDAGWEGLKS